MVVPKIRIALTSRISSHGWEFGRSALEVLYAQSPRLHPERIDDTDVEPRDMQPCAGIEDCLKMWAPGKATEDSELPTHPVPRLYWHRGKTIRSYGCFQTSWLNKFKEIVPAGVVMNSGYQADVNFEEIFIEWCKLYQPTRGHLHYFSKEELLAGEIIIGAPEDVQKKVRAWASFERGNFGPNSRQVTYNLGYLNYFPGTEMSNNCASVLEDAGFQVEPIGSGKLLYVLDDLKTVKGNFSLFSERRMLAKEIIGLDQFVIKQEP